MTESFTKTIGARLKEARILKGYTVEQLAKIFECSEDHYRRIERGRYCLSLDKLAKLYSWAGIDPLFLITGKRRWLDLAEEKDEGKGESMSVMRQLMGYCNTVVKDGAGGMQPGSGTEG